MPLALCSALARRTLPGFLLLLVLAGGGWASVTVTPRTIAAVPGREQDRTTAVSTLREAVEIANLFLASDYRKTLPAGRLVLQDDSLTFVTPARTLPVRIRCSSSGDILIPLHMAAQERAVGFVVGLVAPRQRREIDNSLFKDKTGNMLPNYVVAATILHELTHSFFGAGA
jgi:hypothetical protein